LNIKEYSGFGNCHWQAGVPTAPDHVWDELANQQPSIKKYIKQYRPGGAKCNWKLFYLLDEVFSITAVTGEYCLGPVQMAARGYARDLEDSSADEGNKSWRLSGSTAV